MTYQVLFLNADQNKQICPFVSVALLCYLLLMTFANFNIISAAAAYAMKPQRARTLYPLSVKMTICAYNPLMCKAVITG